MKEKIDQLEKLLAEISKLIERHLEIKQIDLGKFDADYKSKPNSSDDTEKHFYSDFRKTITYHKNNSSFNEYDIPRFESLLSTSLKELQLIKDDPSELSSIENKNRRPNPDIIKLIKQGILNTKSPIYGEKNNKVFSGFLTEDGYLKLNSNGSFKKFGSLRYAAFKLWGSDNQSSWKFWKAKITIDSEEESLEYFKNLIE
ncbi:MAG: hypothetical protein ABI691_06830 [Ginsengibacter sp.]